MAVSDILYDNWGNVIVIDMLYEELPIEYELETTIGVIPILEPIEWENVPFIHKRDTTYHGFTNEYTGADISLKFDCDSGMDEIAAEYALNGNDGVVLFRRILTYDGTPYIEYEGKLNLNTLKREDFTLSCTCERKSIHELINSRKTTNIDLDSATDLDDNELDIIPYSYSTVQLQGQVLSEKTVISHTVVNEYNETIPTKYGSYASLLFDFNEPTVNTIKGFGGTSLSVLLSGVYEQSLYTFSANGSYDININLDFNVKVGVNPAFLKGGTIKKVWVAIVLAKFPAGLEAADAIYEVIHSSVPVDVNLQNVDFPRTTISKDMSIDVETGDRILIYAQLIYVNNVNKLKSIDFTVKQYKAEMTVTGHSEVEPSRVHGRMIKDAIDGLYLRVTGVTDNVISNFYSPASAGYAVDGCGYARMITNGGLIRKAPVGTFPLTTNISDMLQSLNAIDAIGMGYEWDAVNKKELIRIETKDYFYKDAQVIEIIDVFNYSEETAKDQIYNKIDIGYDKYKEEDENSLDEIHAYHEYQTPITSETNEYLIRSKYIASGYLTETTRRVQFDDDEDMATSYDDDIFIIDLEKDLTLIPGYGYVRTPLTNEPFTESTGLISSSTTLNQLLSVKRMLMAHSKWLMSSLIYKGASLLVKNTVTKQNKDFSTTLKEDWCRRGDDALLPLKASDNIILSVFGDGTGIYSPEWVTFSARLKMSDVRYIINAHRGLSPDNNNYGYILFPDDTGTMRKGWLYELSFNRESEEVTFKLLKKKFP